jgi:hypothetical protein
MKRLIDSDTEDYPTITYWLDNMFKEFTAEMQNNFKYERDVLNSQGLIDQDEMTFDL